MIVRNDRRSRTPPFEPVVDIDLDRLQIPRRIAELRHGNKLAGGDVRQADPRHGRAAILDQNLAHLAK
jgi:hypothetical protein